MATTTTPRHRRMLTRATFRLRCGERATGSFDRSAPIKLVVFDFDETLTMATYMPAEDDTREERRYLTRVNFETPWVPGSRRKKLRRLLADLAVGPDGQRQRGLAILTKNSNPRGVWGVLDALQDAGLADLLDALWLVPCRPGQPSGAYRVGNRWLGFTTPAGKLAPFKADFLQHVAVDPSSWFPQLKDDRAGAYLAPVLTEGLALENIALIDDQRANFQSGTGAQVLRYCKVARYDAFYLDLGWLKDMGGIGAHSDEDYEALMRWVETPWMCKESLQVHCCCRSEDSGQRPTPVKVVVFDFDETLTVATFMPQCDDFCRQIGWTPAGTSEEWTAEELLLYNFQSPFVEGDRLARLRALLTDLSSGGPGATSPRVLAVLTRNPCGAVAVLNLLMLADLDQYFSAIWAMPDKEMAPAAAGIPAGACRSAGGQWQCFDTPVGKVHDHKADILRHMVTSPALWFPQLANGEAAVLSALTPAAVVLVDDERTSFASDGPDRAKVLRYCKVARYDEHYRDCGPLNQMGGLGAHSDGDFDVLRAFVDRPWEFPDDPSAIVAGLPPCPVLLESRAAEQVSRQRVVPAEETRKAPRAKQGSPPVSPPLREFRT